MTKGGGSNGACDGSEPVNIMMYPETRDNGRAEDASRIQSGAAERAPHEGGGSRYGADVKCSHDVGGFFVFEFLVNRHGEEESKHGFKQRCGSKAYVCETGSPEVKLFERRRSVREYPGNEQTR